MNERPVGTVVGLEEEIKFIYFMERVFHRIFLIILHDTFFKIESEADRQRLYNKVVESMIKLSHLSKKARVDFLSGEIEEVEKYIESHDFEFIHYHYGVSSNSLRQIISIMENLRLV